MTDTVNVLSISGGKDSTAMWLYAIEQGAEVMPVFADTGHEHSTTYEYVEYLESKLGKVKRVKADFTEDIQRKREFIENNWFNSLLSEGVDEVEAQRRIESALEVLHPTGNPFLDLCLWKGRFPSTKARFCTQFLKIKPIFDQVYIPLWDKGKKIVSWQGVRADESLARSKLNEYEETPEGLLIYRPLLKWTVEDVFAIHKRMGIEPNPLYLHGMGRVGCMPCINANKDELYEIARRFPDEIDRVAKMEELVSKSAKQGGATFFHTRDEWGESIYKAVEWSKTSYGGKQYDLEKLLLFDDEITCTSKYGLCE